MDTESSIPFKNELESADLNSFRPKKELQLFDEIWPSLRQAAPQPAEEHLTVEQKLWRMRHFYTVEEQQQERRQRLVTNLQLYVDLWDIKKRLTESDINGQARLMINKDSFYNHISPFFTQEHAGEVRDENHRTNVAVWDMDTESQHRLILRRWRSSGCYVFNGDWGRDFVKRRNLRTGDEIGMFWDKYKSRFNFRVLHRAPIR